ncbi:hypothetical protein NKH72_25755 [Mesorhizobium sp. M0955]|uniref:hypothetical protein n=1 Tax=unclassified Mesorhizobium TaxID=325217 RepID=UPI0033352F36
MEEITRGRSARLQCFDEFGFDIDAKGLRIDGPSMTQGASTRSCRSAAMKVIVFEWPYGAWAISRTPQPAQRRHVGLDPCFIQEDQARRVNAGLIAHPLRTPAHQLWLELLDRQSGFFEALALAVQEATDARRRPRSASAAVN